MSTSPQVVLLSQGDELLSGQTVDTNTSWLADQLTDMGLRVARAATAPDDRAAIERAVREALTDVTESASGGAVICTGGLGPTSDDLTAEAVAAVTGRPLALHEPSLERIRALFAAWGRDMPESNVKQAMMPQGSAVLENRWGTAPGFMVEHASERGTALAFFLPGVPREMRQFWTHHVQPALSARLEAPPSRRVLLRCMGIAESSLQQRLDPFLGEPGLTISFRTKLPENQVKLIFDPLDGEEGVPEARVRDTLARALAVVGRSCFGADIDGPCGDIALVVGELLAARGETVATAESCTGGQVSAQLTAHAGSSRYFLEGACVYANAAKVRTCGVRQEDLDAVGAVSEEVARAMAEGIRDRAGTTYGIATTGIAGPGGGRPGKPVGTVHLAVATPSGTLHRRLGLRGVRARITAMSAGLALDMLRRHLQFSST